MKLRAGWLRYWLGAALIGVATGVFVGLYETLPPTATSVFEENNYLGHRLYATATQLLVTSTDRWIPMAIGLALLLAALIRIGKLGHGNVRRFLRFGLPLLTVSAIAVLYFVLHLNQWYTLKAAAKSAVIFCGHLIFNPFSLLLTLALLAWIEWRILRARRRKAMPKEAEGETREQAATGRSCFPFLFCQRILRSLAIAVIGLLVILCAALYLARGLYRWQTLRALRGKPNIIFIMVDTLRVDHLGCYGYDLPTTPNIDRFAAKSTRFAHAIAPSSWTVWSVNSIFTSQYPDVLFASHLGFHEELQIDIQASNFGTPLGYTTLVEVLYDRGYSTNAVISNPWLSISPGNTQGYTYYNDSPAKRNNECRETSPHVTRAAIDRLREVKDERFFMSLVYMDPHDPYHENPGFTFGDSQHNRQLESVIASSVAPSLLEERRVSQRGYDSEIAYTDHAVGQFLEELTQLGLYDDALIVFFSDHGEEFREHGGTGHQKTVYDEVIRVPLIIKFPRQQIGRVMQRPFPLIDLYPALMKYLQYPVDRLNLQGDAVDLTTLLRSTVKPIFSATNTSAKCIIEGPRKYIAYQQPEEKQEYFDLAADPLEQRNLLARHPAEAQPLIAGLDAWDKRNAVLAVLHAGRGAGLDRTAEMPDRKALIEQLQTLGYLQ
jgi:arylsulfatase A-like enzyme